jgi:acetyltransferase-like isoleucine patch superfamily enzyme
MGLITSGCPRYIGKDVKFDKYSFITLGDRVVISNGCILLTHDYSITTALISINANPGTDIALERKINIGDNVFIGKNSIIMPNTVIGNNVIIGAGSVVRGKIPSDSIVIGNPCQVVGNVKVKAKDWLKYLESDIIRKD